MKFPPLLLTLLLCALPIMAVRADDAETPDPLELHQEGAAKVADEQDELSADVQQLVIEQTIPQVIQLLSEVEGIMDEVTDRLAEAETGGETLAAQTEIIEKIHAAAKKRQSQGKGGQSGSAMMDMMERMMGKDPGDKKGKGKGEQPGNQGGEGSTGNSDSSNDNASGAGVGKVETRTVPKAAGSSNLALPDEFRKAFDAYNRGVGEKLR